MNSEWEVDEAGRGGMGRGVVSWFFVWRKMLNGGAAVEGW